MRLRFKLVDFNIAVTSEINLCDVLVKKKKKLPYETAIPLLDMYPKEMKTGNQKDICLFTVAVFSQNVKTT